MVSTTLNTSPSSLYVPKSGTFYCHTSTTEAWEYISKIHQNKNYSGLLTGVSGVGKSYLAKTYTQQFPQSELDEKNIIPVLYVKLGATSTPTDLLHQILMALGCTVMNSKERPYTALERLLHLLNEQSVELIIIDEVQECLPDTDGIRAQQMAKQFAGLVDKASIPVILMGTPLAKRIIELAYKGGDKEEQLSRRFLAPHQLSPCPSQCQAWINMVNFYQLKYGFNRLTAQSHKDLLNRIYIATNGMHGLLNKLYAQMLPADYKNTAQYIRAFEEAYKFAIRNSEDNPFNADMINAQQTERNIEDLDRKLKETFTHG